MIDVVEMPMRRNGNGPLAKARCCVICGASLAGRRSDGHCCSGACRAERSRLRAILDGSGAAPYPSVRARVNAARKRTSPVYGDAEGGD